MIELSTEHMASTFTVRTSIVRTLSLCKQVLRKMDLGGQTVTYDRPVGLWRARVRISDVSASLNVTAATPVRGTDRNSSGGGGSWKRQHVENTCPNLSSRDRGYARPFPILRGCQESHRLHLATEGSIALPLTRSRLKAETVFSAWSARWCLQVCSLRSALCSAA
jgi:hypothetical protein